LTAARLRRGLLAAALAGACACSSGAPPRLRDAQAPLAGAAGGYRVLLPPGYPAASPYPVVYFLHGLLNQSSALWRQGVAQGLVARMAAGELPPFVLAAPDGGNGYWSDAHDGSRAYETWVTGGLRERVEAAYAVRRDRAGRAVIGISMGGYGALKAGLRHPDLYGQAGSLSGAILRMDWNLVETTFLFNRWALKRSFGRERTDNSLAANDLMAVLAAAPLAPRARLWLHCGEQDRYGLAAAAARFHAAAGAAGFVSTLVLEPGDHDWEYWRRSTLAQLAEIANGFAPPAGPG